MDHLSDMRAGANIMSPYILHPLLAAEVFLPQKWPFWSQTKFITATDIPNLNGKTILVTGGNAGIGRESILQLAHHHPEKIYLAARTQNKAEDAIAQIKEKLRRSDTIVDVDIEWLPLDLTSLESVQKAAQIVLQKSQRLDLLMLNAGIMGAPPSKTEEGYEIQLGTNHIGHFLLTRLLLPLLEKTASTSSDVRIITVSSEASNGSPSNIMDLIRDQSNLLSQSPFTRYGVSKAANILFATELARRHPNLTSVAVHPGIIMTDLYLPSKQRNAIMKHGLTFMAALLFDDVPHGALNQLWTAVAPKDELVSGAYYTPVGKRRDNYWTQKPEIARMLWEWTEREMERLGY